MVQYMNINVVKKMTKSYRIKVIYCELLNGEECSHTGLCKNCPIVKNMKKICKKVENEPEPEPNGGVIFEDNMWV